MAHHRSEADLTHLIVEFYERLSSWEHGVVRGKDVSLPQMHAVEILGAHGPLRMKELASHMGVTTGTMTVTVDNLEGRGLVERRPNENDRRSVMVELTGAGREYFAEHDKLHRQLTDEMTAGLSAEESAAFAAILTKVLRTF